MGAVLGIDLAITTTVGKLKLAEKIIDKLAPVIEKAGLKDRAEAIYKQIADGGGGEVSTKDIPSIGNTPGKGGFAEWFDNLDEESFDIYWSNPETKAKIQRLLREPGGFHEWSMVSRTDKFKNWGFSTKDIWSFRTTTKNLTWINPITGLPGKHGGHGSGPFHHELGQLIDNSKNMGELNSGLISLSHRWNIPNLPNLIRK